MTKLVMRLFGGFHVQLHGKAVHGFESDKGRALLAYLVVGSDRPHRRESVASLLWPDRPDVVARKNLRQALFRLRQALCDYEPPHYLFVTPTDVQFNTASDFTLDVAELEAFARSPARHSLLLPEAFCADFLAGLSVPDSETFQAWVLDTQEHYHRLTLSILDEQAAYFEGIGDYEKAIAAARLQLRMEPWLEEAHRRCMRDLALGGRRDEALHQYEWCCRSLEAELAAEPSESTRCLYADIRDGRLTAPRGSEAPRGEVSRGEDGPQTHSPRQGTPMTPYSRARPARLAGREDESGWLTRCLYGALAGETGVAFVSGDPGSGKTTLLEAFAGSALAEHPGLLVAGARCAPGGSQDPFAPLRRLTEMLFGDLYRGVAWHPGGREEVERLGAATSLALACLDEHGPALAGTLIPTASIARRAGSSSDSVRGRLARGALAQAPLPQAALSQGILFDQLLCTLAAIAAERPLVVLLDDLHWVDDATAAFLLHLARELSGSRLLVLGAYRPEPVEMGRRDPVTGDMGRHPLASTIDELRRLKGEILVELDRANGRAFVEAFVDTEPNRLGARFRDALYAQTAGHALFTVELLRNLQARGELTKDEAGRWVAKESLDWGRLPARVEAAIAERIERLPEQERELLSCASVQGDDFSGEMVAEFTGRPLREVVACLSGTLARQHHLLQAEGLTEPTASAEPSASAKLRVAGGQRTRYRFTHHLFQKYLYDQLDPVERMQIHAAVAAGLDRQAGDDPAERERLSAQLAWHYEAGGMPVQAARALLEAGRRAMRVSAMREAMSLYEHGLALLADAPPSERLTTEWHEVRGLLEVAQLGPRRNLEGLGGAGLEGAAARASEVGASEAKGRAHLMLLWAKTEHLLGEGQLEAALAGAWALLAVAEQCGDEDFAAVAGFHVGFVHHYMGNPRESESNLDRLLSCLTPERRAGVAAATGMDVHAVALAVSALNRWFLGYPEAALVRSREAIAAGRAGKIKVGQAASNGLGATLLYLVRGDEAAGTLAAQAEECHRVALEQGLVIWQVFAEALLGRVMVMRGDTSGLDRMGSDAWRSSRMAIGVDHCMLVLADSCLLAAGRCEPGAAARAELLARGLAAIDSMLGPHRAPCGQIHEAELRRLEGELLLARDGLAAAEEALECFRQAMQLGREKGALAWQLRAAMSLVRLRERQGEAYARELAEARACLRDVYDRFTEGFAFPDLQDAAALIGNWEPS